MTRSNKLISLILAFLMFAGLISAPVIAETEPLGKTATLTDASFIAPIDPDIPSDAIHIQTPEELAAIGGAASEGKYYVLDNDINLVEEWMPIDDFRGTLDGQGYSVNNLWMAVEPPASSSHIGAGLFGKITKSVVIKNLGVNIGEQGITASAAEKDGKLSFGGLIGSYDGNDSSTLIIDNCIVVGSILNYDRPHFRPTNAGGLIGDCYGGDVTIKNSFADGEIYASVNAGGLIGGGIIGEKMAIENCYFAGVVDAGSAYPNRGVVGGLIGGCYGYGVRTIKNSFSTGSVRGLEVAGGLAGDIRGDTVIIEDCYSNSDIYSWYWAGGLIGTCLNAEIKNCYAIGDVFAEGNPYSEPSDTWSYAGGLAGIPANLVATNSYRLSSQSVKGIEIETIGESLTEAQMREQDSFVGWDFDSVWGYIGSDDYPVLRLFGSIYTAVLSVSISTELEEPIWLLTGDTENFTATIKPFAATNKAVIWQSDNPAVATVDENGLVTAIAGGETVITVTAEDGGLADSCTVRVSDGGIDYTPIDDIIIYGKIDDVEDTSFEINLTAEAFTIPAEYKPAAYSINNGNKWKAIKEENRDIGNTKNPFNNANFPKFFNKDLTLHLSDKPIDRSTKKPETGATIVIFGTINKRAVLPKLKVNYAIGADKAGDTTGTWLLAWKSSVGDVSEKEGLVIAQADASKKHPNEKGFGKFIGRNGTTNGIVVRPLNSNDKQVKITYLYKIGAFGSPTRYRAASKTKKVSVRGQGKAPNYKIKGSVIKIRAGTSVVLDGEQMDYSEKTDVNVTDYIGTTGLFWLYATAKKPASKQQELEI